MTEQGWLLATGPQPMLDFLHGKASERKLRLFAVACCRSIWHLLANERSRQAVELSERYADGNATEEEVIATSDELYGVVYPNQWAACYAIDPTFDCGYENAGQATFPYTADAAICCANEASGNISGEVPPRSLDEVIAEQTNQCHLLNDIFGNPFRLVAVNPSWLTWHDGTVLKMAQIIYDERAFKCLPVLADALEEAGCHDADILGHCRQPGPHVRGCWVVDLLLGKE